jgi:hypothetical protein
MLYGYFAVLFLLGISLAGNLSLTQPVWAETLVQSIVETRLTVALRVGQAELQSKLPALWQVNPSPGGPFKESNFSLVFNDSLLVQDAQGKPDMGGINRYVFFMVPAKHTQTGEVAVFIIGGLASNILYTHGPYKNYVQATLRRQQTYKGANIEAGLVDDFWEVRDTRGGGIELRVQYQTAIPSRAKSETKVYSAVEPGFYHIYRLETAMDIVKSIPTGIDRVQNYQLRVAVPELSKLFDGTEQVVGIAAYPMFLRLVFLP